MKVRKLCLAALAAGTIIGAQGTAFAQAEKVEKSGSLHVQCDGNPNNMSAGETAARLVGIVALVGLLAPPPEAADASKRKFGSEGVDACSSLIDGESRETNASRRVPLILARAIHRIEAKDYDGAVVDTEIAQQEAQAAGMLDNPYYARSQGRAFDLIAAAALYRAGKVEDARTAALRNLEGSRFQLMPLLSIPDYLLQAPSPSPAEAELHRWRAGQGFGSSDYADRLEEWGRFAEAAAVREAIVDFNLRTIPDAQGSAALARSAVTLALAGNAELSDTRMTQARANYEKRRSDGNPDTNASEIIELFDLHAIIREADKGNSTVARRLFSARSSWAGASFGSIVEVTRRLREGASSDELIGGLSRDADTLWKERLDAARAQAMAKDADNKTLFQLIPAAETAAPYRSLSKQVWRTDKSKLVMKIKDDGKQKLKMERMFAGMGGANAVLPGYMLHAALLAKSRGQQGFAILPMMVDQFIFAGFITGNKGDAGLSEPIFMDAEQVIASLSKTIPSPEMIKAEQKAAKD